MKARLEDKKKAIELRKQGLSYKEIQVRINVSKSLLSGWLKYLDLDPQEEAYLLVRMKERQDKGRIASMISNRNRRMNREMVDFEEARILFNKFKNDSFFLLGVALYWAEGAKRNGEFSFINSDPEMVNLMYLWIPKYLGIEKESIKIRLFTHKIPDFKNLEIFWAHTLGVDPHNFKKTCYKPTQYGLRKNPNYKGCIRLTVGGISKLRIVKAWQKLLIQYYDNVLKNR